MELSKNKMSVYSSLGSRKFRTRHGLFIVEGEKSVADTLSHYDLEALIVRKGFDLSSGLLDRSGNCPVYYVGESEMKKISCLSTPAPIVAIYKLPSSNENDLVSIPDNELYLMLDGIQDPGNLGTIVRTAHWFGIKRIFASLDTVDIYNPKTIQSTMGSLAVVKVCYCNLDEVIERNPAMPVYGLVLDGENIYNAKLGTNGFIVMGNEGKGISEKLRRLLTDRLLIPPYDPTQHSESLNVGVATAVTLSVFRSRAYIK